MTIPGHRHERVAEEILHVSGVMATIAAGLTIGGWGRMKVSYAVRDYLEHFWDYLAGRSSQAGGGRSAIWSWVGRHSYPLPARNVKKEKP